ncbi:MAG TPA: hypothetical protein VLB85_04740 [Acidimicrobiia bacterium]|nr:hypothetical protein [Acidimicrobiia bacterium]
MALLPMVAQAESVALSPRSGPPGTSVAITGEDFEDEELVAILWDGVLPIGTTFTDDDGDFATTVTIPLLTSPGNHQIVIVVDDERVSTSFVVQGQVETTTTTTTATTTTTTTVPPPPPTTTLPTTTTTTRATTTTTRATTTTTRPTTTTTTRPTTTTTRPTTTTTRPTTTTTTTDATATTEATTDTSAPTTSTGPTTTLFDLTDDTLGFIDFGGDPPSEAAAPQLAGESLTVSSFALSPRSGSVGSIIQMTVEFADLVPALSTVRVAIDGSPLGDPVPVEGESLSLRRTVPNLAPGDHTVTLVSDDSVVAEATFTVTGSEAAQPGGMSAVPLIGLVVTVGLLAWFAVHTVRRVAAPGTGLGPIAAYRARRGRAPFPPEA